MSPSSDQPSSAHSFLALVFVWTLFAGYILLPASYPQSPSTNEYTGCVEHPEYWDCPDEFSDTHSETMHLPPLFYLSALACGTGILGCLYLWWKHQKKYEWLIKRIFLPALCNSAAGLWSALTIANAVDVEQYSRTMRVVMVAPSAGSVVAAGVGLGYYAVMLWLVNRDAEEVSLALEKGKERLQDR